MVDATTRQSESKFERRFRLDALSRRVIGEATAVRSRLGFGFCEKVYENALAVRLAKESIPFQQQVPIHVHFEEVIVGLYVPDMLVGDGMIVEIKTAPAIASAFRVQVLNYLCATGLSLGLVLNFGPTRLEIARLVHDH